MALARQPMPEVRTGPIQWNSHRLLLIVAGAIAILCGCGAFLLLVMRDHGHANVMVNEQSSPTLLTKSSPAASRVSEASKAADAGKASPMVKPAEAVNPIAANTPKQFSLEKSNRRTALGPLKLRVTNTDPVKNTYDVSVFAGRRSSSHRGVKVNEPLWIALNRGAGAIELVVTSIDASRVGGYWTESNHSPQVSSRTRGRRR